MNSGRSSLTRFNAAYFVRLRARLKAAERMSLRQVAAHGALPLVKSELGLKAQFKASCHWTTSSTFFV